MRCFGFGLIFYEMLKRGKKLIDGKSKEEIKQKVLGG
jgi:hypothetical protein